MDDLESTLLLMLLILLLNMESCFGSMISTFMMARGSKKKEDWTSLQR
jgi:hypothetical protein